MGPVSEADRGQGLRDPLLAPRQAVQPGEEVQVLGHRQPAVQARGFGHDRDALADLLRAGRVQREPRDHGGPGGRRDQRAEDPHRRGLASTAAHPVPPEQRKPATVPPRQPLS